jgi:hypothetical protein
MNPRKDQQKKFQKKNSENFSEKLFLQNIKFLTPSLFIINYCNYYVNPLLHQNKDCIRLNSSAIIDHLTITIRFEFQANHTTAQDK